MSDLVEAASAIISQAQRRAEISGHNIANASTPAFKRAVPFAQIVNQTNGLNRATPVVQTATDVATGKLVSTGNPYDLAITRRGYFALRGDEGVIFSRDGRFTRREDGRLINAQGLVLQTASGGDVIVTNGPFRVRSDGLIEEGSGVGERIALYPGSISCLSAASADIHQWHDFSLAAQFQLNPNYQNPL